jgi:CheY-like chemotaxis protein
MDRRQHDRLTRPGRRLSDRRTATADQRRVLLVGPNEAWRLLTAYMFEESGYTVYAAADHWQAVAFATRLLPDVVVVAIETPEALEILVRLAAGPTTQDIPVVVLTSSLHSITAQRARDAGGVPLLAHAADVDVLVGEVDTLIAAAPRARRTLKRRLLDIQELARFYPPDQEGQRRLRDLIDRLQVAIFAVDAEGHCIAASEGATRLTGHSRGQWLRTSVCHAGVPGGPLSDARWRGVLAAEHEGGTMSITTRAGGRLPVHAVAVAELLPGVHVAAFAAR